MFELICPNCLRSLTRYDLNNLHKDANSKEVGECRHCDVKLEIVEEDLVRNASESGSSC